MTGKAYIGTSGWNYRHWKDDFYAGVKPKDWLRFCAERFTAIEVNATFYRLQRSETFARWRDETPAAFRFAIKGNRYLTHSKKLLDPELAIRKDRARAQELRGKLAAVVWQLPRQFRINCERLVGFAAALRAWSEVRHAIEFRHASWFTAEVADCLSRYELAVCLSDAADWPLWDAVTTDLVYVRLHGHPLTYASAYSDESLAYWAARIRSWQKEQCDVHVYFDNDAEGAAPQDALQLLCHLKWP